MIIEDFREIQDARVLDIDSVASLLLLLLFKMIGQEFAISSNLKQLMA